MGYGDATWVDGGDASLEGNVLWGWSRKTLVCGMTLFVVSVSGEERGKEGWDVHDFFIFVLWRNCQSVYI